MRLTRMEVSVNVSQKADTPFERKCPVRLRGSKAGQELSQMESKMLIWNEVLFRKKFAQTLNILQYVVVVRLNPGLCDSPCSAVTDSDDHVKVILE